MQPTNPLEKALLDYVRVLRCPPPSANTHSTTDLNWLPLFWLDISQRARQALLRKYEIETVKVRSVPDGDGLNITRTQKVRYLGIDAPEIGAKGYVAQPFSLTAKRFNARLVKGRTVQLIRGSAQDTDPNGRLLRHVFVGNYWINVAILLTGLAWPAFLEQQEPTIQKLLQGSARRAQKEHLGLWRYP